MRAIGVILGYPAGNFIYQALQTVPDYSLAAKLALGQFIGMVIVAVYMEMTEE